MWCALLDIFVSGGRSLEIAARVVVVVVVAVVVVVVVVQVSQFTMASSCFGLACCHFE